MTAPFHAAVARLDSLLRQHFPAAGSAAPQLKLDVLDFDHFTGSKATFSRSFGSLRNRRWLDFVECPPEWLTSVGQAIADLEQTARSPTEAKLYGEFLTRDWVQAAHLAEEPRQIAIPSVADYVLAWEFTITLHQYDPEWLSPLVARTSEEDSASGGENRSIAADSSLPRTVTETGVSRPEQVAPVTDTAPQSATLNRKALATLLDISQRTLDRRRSKDRRFPKPLSAQKGSKPLWSRVVVERYLRGE